MLKEERLQTILELLNTNGIVRVADLTSALNVTEMTVRRDLKQLEEASLIKRIHGGATLPDNLTIKELSHHEKQKINIEEKKQVAEKIASLIEENYTIFLGAGTTIELVFDYMKVFPNRIITNSYYIFNKFKSNNSYDLILIGGSYRSRTGAFVGSIANNSLAKINVHKSFIGVNGVYMNQVYTSNEEEGTTQSIVLDNSKEKYIVADHSKIGKKDFFSFYNLDEITAVITDEYLTEQKRKELENYTKVIN